MSDTPEQRRRRAIALRYDEHQDQAPLVVATGQGHLAERIVDLAQEHGVHIHTDPVLAGMLAQLDVHATIPEELYHAVAEVLAFVYKLNREIGGS